MTIGRRLGSVVIFVGFGVGFPYCGARQKVAEDFDVQFISYRGSKMDLVHPTAEGYQDLAAGIVDRLTIDGVLEQLNAQRG